MHTGRRAAADAAVPGVYRLGDLWPAVAGYEADAGGTQSHTFLDVRKHMADAVEDRLWALDVPGAEPARPDPRKWLDEPPTGHVQGARRGHML